MLRPADDADVSRLWPLARAARIAGTADEFARFRAAGPWRLQVGPRGEAVVLDRWRAHLDVCAVLGVWGNPHAVSGLIEAAASVARAQGFSELVSPLVAVDALLPYLDAGMAVRERIVALQAPSGLIAIARPAPGVTVRPGAAPDLTDLADIDTSCFDEFWRYGQPELAGCLARERLTVAAGPWGGLLGYATCTVRSGSATLGRLAVRPSARRRRVGSLLLGDAAQWAERAGAVTFTLCTQEHNLASRALYADSGMAELDQCFALASMPLTSHGAPQADTL